MRVGIPPMATVKFHLRGTGAYVWIVVIVVPLGIPSFSRILIDLHPVVLAVFNFARVLQGLSEELPKVVIVGCILKSKVTNIGKILAELLGEALAEILDGGGLLLLTNLLILLLVSGSLETLPGQAAAEEVHENVAEGLEIVSARLLAPQVGVDAHVASRARERLSLAVRNMLLRLGISVLLGHAKVNNMNNIGGLGARAANDEVVGLNITVDEVSLVYRLDARQHLLCHHYNRLDGETAATDVEEILEGRSK